MQILLEKLEKYGFNERPMDESDFYRICEHEGVEIIWHHGKNSWYMTFLGKHYICLSKRLKGLKLLKTMWHEFAHYAAHAGEAANQVFFNLAFNSKDEIEADAMSLIALIPQKDLENNRFLDENPTRFAQQIFRERQRLKFLYQI